MKRLLQLMGGLTLAAVLVLALAHPALAVDANQVTQNTTSQTCAQAGNDLPGCAGPSLLDSNGYFTILFNAIFYIAGLVSTIFLVIGGINYITSTGDSGRIAKAKNTILYAVLGLIVTISARAIAGFVISKLS